MNRFLVIALALLLKLTVCERLVAQETVDGLLTKARAVLAQLDGEISLPGLKQSVEVRRDRWGVPHIYAQSQDDLFFAQGFIAAQDRLWQIDWWRRVAVGQTAEILGKSALEADRFARLVRYRGDMHAEWASYSPDTKQIAEAFTRGINAAIDYMGERLPIEFQLLGYRPAKWQAEDCLGRMAGIVMIRNFASEISRAELIAAVGVEKARRLAPIDPSHDYGPAAGLDLTGIDRSVLAGWTAATKAVTFATPRDGSNNWVIDGTLSASGKPMLANDPHRALAVPALRYLVHLHAPGWNVIGSGEPALPGVALGHNERVAWGFTIVGTDQGDIYVEETHPDDPDRYRVGDRWESMTIEREAVRVKGEANPITVELRWTRHGPVLHQDRKRNRAFALRWVGSEPGTAGYLGALALSRAGNRDQFLGAVEAWKLPSENIVYADVDGTIGWIAAAASPIRKGWDGLLPVPGAEGKYEWQGFLPVEELPQVFNPASHFVVTANHNIVPRNYPHPLAFEWATHHRYRRLHTLLEAKTKFTLDDFKRLQHDETSLLGLRLAEVAAKVDMRDAELNRQRDELARWDGVLSRRSRPGAVYAAWLRDLLDEFFRPHVPANLLTFVRGGYGVDVLQGALEQPSRDWFGDDPAKERDELVRRTFTTAVKKLREAMPGDSERWTWGRLHQAAFTHPLASLGPIPAEAFNLPPVERGGDALTPNNARHDEKFRQIHGASYRELFDLSDWDRGLATSVPGQSGQPASEYYGDLLPLWAEGEYFPLAFSRAKVEEVTKHRLVLKPAGR